MNKVDPKELNIPNVNYSMEKEIDIYEEKAERFKKQRLSRGYDDSEWYDLYYTIAKFIRPRLETFRENTVSYPLGLTADRWDRMLNQMIKAFSLVEENSVETKKQVNTVKVGLKLFSLYFLDLWS